MGLDQYANARRGEPQTDAEGYTYYEDSKELAYWRKHLEQLEAAIEGEELPETAGFFFGNDSSNYYREEDLAFIADASEAIKQGYTVVYSSWW